MASATPGVTASPRQRPAKDKSLEPLFQRPQTDVFGTPLASPETLAPSKASAGQSNGLVEAEWL